MQIGHFIQHHVVYLFFLLIVLAIVAGHMGSVAKRKKQRLARNAMGFIDVPSATLFANVTAIEHTFPQDMIASVPETVGKGQSALGETLLFDISYGGGSDAQPATVTAFRVNPALPDFEVRHVWTRKVADLLDGAIASVSNVVRQEGATDDAAQAGPETTATPSPRQPTHSKRVARFLQEERAVNEVLESLGRYPIEIADPGFHAHHDVRGSDEARVRAVLTPAFIAALSGTEFGNLVVHKTGNWLFVCAGSGKLVAAPAEYPHWLERSVALVQKLDLAMDA